MNIRKLAPDISVSPQLSPQDVGLAAAQGFRTIIINRPDGESDDQPGHELIAAAAGRHGLQACYIPIIPGQLSDEDVSLFSSALRDLPAPALAFCRTGTRSATLWALAQAGHLSIDAILSAAGAAGYDLTALRPRLEARDKTVVTGTGKAPAHEVLIIGAGAAGISVAASLLKRRPGLDIAILDPRSEHYYQPGWTLVGGGVFRREDTVRAMEGLIPKGVKWIRTACARFQPERNEVVLEDGTAIGYRVLIAAPGLKLDWEAIDGLKETLGRNGVTSNYLFDMAPYTWQLVQSLGSGKALFTQPPMPIKCAGAPQKAMYLACDAWRRRGTLKNIDVSFHNSGGILFGVKDYVPALMRYVRKYNINLNFNETLVAVDGPARKAWFEIKDGTGNTHREEKTFDMLHVCPPQTGLDFIRNSPLANAAGWIDVNPETLQHTRYGNVFSLGDAASTPNAKTAAAIRKQAPVCAHNVLCVIDAKAPTAVYNGYGSCPLTVERGKIVLAEFAYGGKLDPSIPGWILDGTKPTRAAWFLKEKMLPSIYFDMMLKGHETLARPAVLPLKPSDHEAQPALANEAPVKVA